MKRIEVKPSGAYLKIVLCCLLVRAVLIENAVQAAPLRRSSAHPQIHRGLPPRDYQYRLQSQTVSALSSIALPLREEKIAQVVSAATIGGREESAKRQIKLFQLPKAELVVNERKISRIAFQLDEEGMWTLSLRGDFHERGVERIEPYVDDHLKRCQFQVRLRCYARYPAEESESNLTTGKPVVLQTCEIRFWVQSGEPYNMWKHGCCQKWYGKEYFDLIDRAEIDFCYYEAAGVTRPISVTPGAE